jgi:hypothetical protein
MSKIMVGIPTSEMARQAIFYDFYNTLVRPDGTLCMFAHGQSPARNRNLIIETALEHNCTHILFLDDDLQFKPDTLTRLLERDKDIVCGYYLMRNYPHAPILFSEALEDGRCRTMFPKDGVEPGLVKMVATGLGCALIKTEVFRDLEKPWIRLGELEKDHWCDDIGFFRRVRDLNKYEMWCDLSIVCGHMGTVAVYPTYQDGKWYTTYNTQGAGQVAFPAVQGIVASESKPDTPSTPELPSRLELLTIP